MPHKTLSPQARATRNAILEAALTCFAASGFRGTPLRAIARRAGVTQPLISHYFGSKENLVEAVVDAAVADYTQRQVEQFEREIGDLKFFTVGLRVLFDWLGENPEIMRLASWARLEGNHSFYRDNNILPVVWAQIDHARLSGRLRPGVSTGFVLALIDCTFKGYWDRRDQYLAAGMLGSETDALYGACAIETVLRGILQGPALDEALGHLGEPSPV